MKVKVILEMEVDEIKFPTTDEGVEWFMSLLMIDKDLILWSKEIAGEISSQIKIDNISAQVGAIKYEAQSFSFED